MTDLQNVIAALVADGDDFDRMLSSLSDAEWDLPTPAPGWTIRHQVAHLIATFMVAGLAARDPQAFGALASTLSDDFDANVTAAMSPFLGLEPATLKAKLHSELGSAADALAKVPADSVVPWLVRPIPPTVLACAGMMELFGHGQDVADTVAYRRTYTDRLAYLVGFGVRVWDFGYLARNLPTPDVQFRFEITSPSGRLLAFGPEDAAQRITGPAVDFCQLVTRRRHHDDLAVTATGPDATYWLEVAQAYRGPAGEGRQSSQSAA